ncbi:MAG: EAL domain-containing protein [Ahrensia sp.]|nr:EAL domain-containing protein [Ahrensia sp.]
MSNNGQAAKWMGRLVVAVCIGVIALLAGVIAAQTGLVNPTVAAFLAVLICLSVIVYRVQAKRRTNLVTSRRQAVEAAMVTPSSDKSVGSGFRRLTSQDIPASSARVATGKRGQKDLLDARQKVSTEAVQQALGKSDLVIFLQPIVRLPQKDPVYFQTLLRLQLSEGTLVDPVQYEPIAEAERMMPAIDQLNLDRSLILAGNLQNMVPTASLFCRVSSASLRNGKACDRMKDLLSSNSETAADLVLEVTQSCFESIGVAGRKRLAGLAATGPKLCLSKMHDADCNIDALKQSGFGFIKIPIDELSDDRLAGRASGWASLISSARAAGMVVIVSGLSRGQDATRLLDLNVAIAQGKLYAEPKRVKEELLR